jgi:hypothetical protein
VYQPRGDGRRYRQTVVATDKPKASAVNPSDEAGAEACLGLAGQWRRSTLEMLREEIDDTERNS